MKRFISTTLGFFTYASIVMQWLWFTVGHLVLFKDNETLRALILPSKAEHPPQTLSFNFTPSASLIIGIFITIIAIAITIYLLAKVPRTLQKSGDTLTVISSEAIAEYLRKHRQIQPKDVQKTTFRMTQFFFLLLISPPLAGVFMQNALSLSYKAAGSITLLLAGISLFWAILYLHARNALPQKSDSK